MSLADWLNRLAGLVVPALSLLIVVVAVGAVIAMYVTRQRRLREFADQAFLLSSGMLPLEGIRVPLLASYGGIKGLGPLAFGRNNLNPLLRLYEDRVEVRVLFKRQRTFNEIEKVDTYFNQRHLKLFYNDGGTFAAYIPNREALAAVVRFFERKGVAIGEKARELVGGGQSPPYAL